MSLLNTAMRTLAFAWISLFCANSTYAALNTLEVGVANLPATTGNALTTIDFVVEFSATPLVFVMTTDEGADPCTLRIDSVTTTSFELGCVEPVNEDGSHPGMTVDYIAIIPGVTTVPSNNGGSVIFEAGVVQTSEQVYGPTCTNCSGAQGWETINFTSSFASPPVLLTNIQTIATGTGNNPFIDTAVRNLNNGSVQVSLDQMEAGTGPITADETIAYLAVETTGCEDLDFSSFDGPSSMVFQSVLGGNVDGWGNNCSSGEGASFAAGCFTSTPVAIAKQSTRAGNNGGMLRRCSVSASEIILTYDEDQVSNNERNHIDEQVGVLAFGSVFTTPVTLSHTHIKRNDKRVEFRWQTATETFNIGFNLWGQLDGGWIPLNRRLIPSVGTDNLRPQDYRKRVKLSRYQANNIELFGISSVDADGKETFFGPFETGRVYGEQAQPEPIDWQAVRQQLEQTMLERGFVRQGNRWVRANRVRKLPSDRLDIEIREAGIYQITFAQVQAAGLDWAGVKLKDIALTYKGKPLSRRIISHNGRFDQGDKIHFYASPPSDNDRLYTDTAIYQLSLNKNAALSMIGVEHTVDSASSAANDYLYSISQGKNRFYSDISPADPWLDAELFSYGGPAQKTYTFELPDDILAANNSRLRLKLAGGIDYPADQDHHLQVLVNNVLVADEWADGFLDWQLDIELPAGSLSSGTNEVRLVLPGDTGNAADIVNIDTIELAVSRPLIKHPEDGSLVFAGRRNVPAYAVQLIDYQSDLIAYAFQDGGNIAHIENLVVDDQDRLLLPALVMQNQIAEPIRYWVSSGDNLLQPVAMQKVAKIDLLQQSADYLIIAHDAFISEQLNAYANDKMAQGLATRIVSWQEIVQQYGYGMPTPEAISRFLQAADRSFDYRYVLLVGGHSYDYHDYLQLGSVTFIPTHYRKVNLVNYTPTDVPLVDLDNDGLPDKAIGRWPVRTLSDLSTILKKTRDWQINGMQSARNALLLAEQSEPGLNFAQQLDAAVKPLTSRWTDVESVYMDQVQASAVAQPVGTARQRIIDSINQGVSLTAFNGHGSPSSWTFQGLLNWNHIASLDNAGLPTMVVPLACYTSYYETPSVNSLAHQWLLGGDYGAVIVQGAMVLGEYRENALFARRLLGKMLNENLDIGSAILAVKQSMAPWNYMVNNWALLGDPTLRFVE